MDNINTL